MTPNQIWKEIWFVPADKAISQIWKSSSYYTFSKVSNLSIEIAPRIRIMLCDTVSLEQKENL